ncbi:cell division cycle protein 123 homolog, partial [Clonorchis sinensis]
MQIDDVKSCAFDSWYDLFKDVTEESVIIPLPKDLVKSLLEDRIILPKSAHLPEPQSEDSDDDCEVWTDESETPERPEFPEFEAKVSDAIAQLGGCVFPKLNWSAPKDAFWLLGDNLLRCRSFTDVYLVLKASDFIAHDLTAPFALCTDFPVENVYDPVEDYRPQLVLRRWKDCRPDSEFRCFVRKKKLI